MMLKRLFDIVVSGCGLLILSPLLVALALLVALSSPGPVLYWATRVGRGGEDFRLLKFRSMVVNADQLGPGITGADDPRVTPMGHFMRRTKLDELPQLINVLRGEMSLVGPRPEDPRYVALYTQVQRQVLLVRPGITSPASIYFRDEEVLLSGPDRERIYVEQVLPAKLAIDLRYTEAPSILEDISIIFHTALALFHK